MGKLRLCLAFHNHQPYGNFGSVFEKAYDDCYRPLVDVLGKHPHARVALHYTGPLLEWLDQNRSTYLDDLRVLVQRNQVELLGGGFYEPMLAVLPDRDAIGQLRMMNQFCKERLGKAPTGMSLAERVWEPDLPRVITQGGLGFTLTDDTHFRYAAREEPRLYGYYITEKAGAKLGVFPIDRDLRYAIPFWEVPRTIELYRLRDEAEREGKECVLTYGDDGEKFGLWPGTHEWVWEKGWLDQFLHALKDHADLVQPSHFQEVLDETAPQGRVYLPAASYEEMMEWSLPAETINRYHGFVETLKNENRYEANRSFVRGGMWQHFFVKYPEANRMHKKMLRVSEKVARAEKLVGPERTAEARRQLYRGQCNCAYWHGLFGGLYLNYLRDAVYRALIDAEVKADELSASVQPREPVTVERVDFDGDLRDEVLLDGQLLQVGVAPTAGGGVFELDWRPTRFNVANVLARRLEAYHEKLRHADQAQSGGQPKSIHDIVRVKEPGLAAYLAYDSHPHHSFVDHFLAPQATLDAVARGEGEVGDFVTTVYKILETQGGQRGRVVMARDGRVGGVPVRIQKELVLDGAKLSVSYEVAAQGSSDAIFAPEISLTLLAGNDSGRFYRLADGSRPAADTMGSRGELHGVQRIELVDEAWQRVALRLTFEPTPTLWRYPLETISQSEDGFERTYQGSVVLPLYHRALASGTPFHAKITLEVVPL